ncbi:SAP30-binding protein [Dissophora globulifera]|nr:SAP30-binding protein [Dissophora globulifera]
MNRGIGLVSYGDSDSEGSDEDTIMTTAPSHSGARAEPPRTQTTGIILDKESDRPTAQDTISAPLITHSRTDSLNKIASNNLLKQGLVAADSAQREKSPAMESSMSSSASQAIRSFARSESGTPLPPDHSAAAEVFNTPTGGRSPQVPQTERVPIADEAAAVRSEVENFGIPPKPVGEINPDVQAKMEQFQHVKVTRGIHFNQSLMRNKNFRNPRIYSSLVELVALNETGSNFEKKEFFDFEGYGPESYASGIAEAQKQAAEKLAQQHAAPRMNLQFVTGATAGLPSLGGEMGLTQASGVVRPQTSLASASHVSALAQAGGAGSQRPRKSKWDVPQPTDDSSGHSKRARH